MIDVEKKQVLERASFKISDPRGVKNQLQALDKMRKDATYRVLEGLTGSPQMGFVFSEFTVEDGDHIYLKQFRPKTREFIDHKIHYGDMPRLSFLQHFRDNQWLAFSEDQGLVLFELTPH